MEIYDIPDQGLADTFMIQGTESNQLLSRQLEQFEAMYGDGALEFIVDQGLYYPTASGYGYLCTGFESTGDFEDGMVFGLDGQDIQYTGGANESLPSAYYTPSYGYEQSPYNPYNPYIPGAIIGMDGCYVTPQQYYSLSSYETPVSSPAYVPVVIQPGHDTIANGITDSYAYNTTSVNQVDGHSVEYNLFSSNSNSSKTLPGGSSTRRNSLVKLSEGSRSIDGPSTQHVPGIDTASFSGYGSSQICRVNASGQFCGVAQMTGPVDFLKDMDFWQQDKWSGSFPVEWHIIKDVPNPNFRHIILENNENKSVTNSRDTQEICHENGLEMLHIFNNYTLKTSLLDDFLYYENRQRILQEERARLLIRSYENPYMIPLVDAPRKFHPVHDFPFVGDEHSSKQKPKLLAASKNKDPADEDPNCSESQSAMLRPVAEASDVNSSTKFNRNGQVSADGVRDLGNGLKIGSLTINAKQHESDSSSPASAAAVSDKVVTIGSMPVKVNGTEFSEILTFGTIPLVPKVLPHG